MQCWCYCCFTYWLLLVSWSCRVTQCWPCTLLTHLLGASSIVLAWVFFYGCKAGSNSLFTTSWRTTSILSAIIVTVQFKRCLQIGSHCIIWACAWLIVGIFSIVFFFSRLCALCSLPCWSCPEELWIAGIVDGGKWSFVSYTRSSMSFSFSCSISFAHSWKLLIGLHIWVAMQSYKVLGIFGTYFSSIRKGLLSGYTQAGSMEISL